MQDRSFPTSYFYCKDGDPERNNCTAVLKGVLKQLLLQCCDLVPYCHDKLQSSGDIILTSASLTQSLLELFCEGVTKQRFIIDGLDECDPPQRKSIMSFFTEMVDKCDRHQPGKLRVLFVSQDYPDIKNALKTAAVISLGPVDNADDIKRYVKHWAMKIQGKFGLGSEQTEALKDLTCHKAQGSSQVTVFEHYSMLYRHVSVCEVGHAKPIWSDFA